MGVAHLRPSFSHMSGQTVKAEGEIGGSGDGGSSPEALI
jgi:hypothetical protein